MHSGGVDSGGSVANWAVPSSSQKCAGKQKNVPKSMLTIWNRAGPEGHHFLGMVSLGEEYNVKTPAYGRHQLSRPMRIVGPIQI